MTDDIPPARTVRDDLDLEPEPLRGIVRAWIRWLPLSIAFAGLSFTAWFIVQAVFVGRYHDAVGRLEQRVKVIETQLLEEAKQHASAYWTRQCHDVLDRLGAKNDDPSRWPY